jgi:AcrR family transcriptional regulator
MGQADPASAAPDPLSLRDRLLAATYQCVERFGLGKTTIEDVVKESGLSRATIYRQFPGGRDELLLETVGWELANYFNALADHVRDAPDLEQLLERGLVFAHRSVTEHLVLQDPRHRAGAVAALADGRVGEGLPFIADCRPRAEAEQGRSHPTSRSTAAEVPSGRSCR